MLVPVPVPVPKPGLKGVVLGVVPGVVIGVNDGGGRVAVLPAALKQNKIQKIKGRLFVYAVIKKNMFYQTLYQLSCNISNLVSIQFQSFTFSVFFVNYETNSRS